MFGSTARYMVRPVIGNPYAGRNKIRQKPQDLANPFIAKAKKMIVGKKSGLVEDVVLLVNNLNDKAFIYKSGRIDILKEGAIVSRKFPNMKDASLYLLKSGWQYVR